MKPKRFIVKSMGMRSGVVREHITIVDEEDAHYLRSSYWLVANSGSKTGNHQYVMRRLANGGYDYLHYVVLGAKKGEHIYHINKNTLDNRKSNLLSTKNRIQELED